MPVLNQNVLGLDVAVHHALAVCVVERVGHLAGQLYGRDDGQHALALQPVAQRLALDEGHDVVEEAVRLAGVVERDDVRVREAGGDFDLEEEALGAERSGKLGPQHLDGHVAVVAAVPS